MHCLVSPPSRTHLPWTWKDGLYKVRDHLTLTTWANHCSCPIRNTVIYNCWETIIWWNPASSFLLLALYDGADTITCALFRTRSSFTVFFCESSPKFCCTVAFYCRRWACSSYAHNWISPSQCAIVSPLSLCHMTSPHGNIYKLHGSMVRTWVNITKPYGTFIRSFSPPRYYFSNFRSKVHDFVLNNFQTKHNCAPLAFFPSSCSPPTSNALAPPDYAEQYSNWACQTFYK